MVLLLCLSSRVCTTFRVSVAHTMFRILREISKEVCSAGGLSRVACNVGENGPVLRKFSASMVWKFTPNNYRILIKQQYIVKEDGMTSPEGRKSLKCVGHWPFFTRHSSILDSPSGRAGGKQTGTETTQTAAEA